MAFFIIMWIEKLSSYIISNRNLNAIRPWFSCQINKNIKYFDTLHDSVQGKQIGQTVNTWLPYISVYSMVSQQWLRLKSQFWSIISWNGFTSHESHLLNWVSGLLPLCKIQNKCEQNRYNVFSIIAILWP